MRTLILCEGAAGVNSLTRGLHSGFQKVSADGDGDGLGARRRAELAEQGVDVYAHSARLQA